MSDSRNPPTRGGDQSCPQDHVKLGVVTISDRASAGIYDDLSGPAVLEFFQQAIQSSWEAIYKVIPDERRIIEKTLCELCDDDECSLVVTTGGTGPAPRDVTPEATESPDDAWLRGADEGNQLEICPHSCAVKADSWAERQNPDTKSSWKPKAIRETIDEVFQSIPACIDLLGGPYVTTHESVVKAFRPANMQRGSKA